MLNCWEDGPDDPNAEYDGNLHGTTCMLPDGHDGPHKFTPDTDIMIGFA